MTKRKRIPRRAKYRSITPHRLREFPPWIIARITAVGVRLFFTAPKES